MRARPALGRFAADERGVAAVEMALVGALLTGALLNVAEVGRYAYIATQVAAASQAGAQAAIAVCDPTEVPVTTSCPEAAGKIAAAVAGTSLADRIGLEGPLHEAWYCVNDQGALQQVETADKARPRDCSGADSASGKPALYLRVRVSHQFQSLFPGLTIAATFPDTIVRTAWMRML